MERPVVTYEGVRILRREHVVLTDISFAIGGGEMVYLMGRVGSGKSSLLKTLYGEVPVDCGTAQVLGYDLTALRRRDIPYLRRKIGIVFQDFRLLEDRTVERNLEFVLRATGTVRRSDIDRCIDRALDSVGMRGKGYKMPHELSGGEQQRIVIARALLNSPPLLIADEPTGNLDPLTAEQIVTHLHDIARAGTTVIMATHNNELVMRHPARTLVCADKHLLEEHIAL